MDVHVLVLEQGDVLAPAAVVVARDVGVLPLADPARSGGDRVPDGGAATVLGHPDLAPEGRGGNTPRETVGQGRVAPPGDLFGGQT